MDLCFVIDRNLEVSFNSKIGLSENCGLGGRITSLAKYVTGEKPTGIFSAFTLFLLRQYQTTCLAHSDTRVEH